MFSQHRFLYVEDDLLSREIMQILLVNAMGVEEFAIFEDSHDFMERLMTLPYQPDVIMLDIHLKPYDGFELLEMLRNTPDFSDTIIIALTASVMNEEMEKLKHGGFSGAIAKPLSIQTFPQLIERVLRGERVWHVA